MVQFEVFDAHWNELGRRTSAGHGALVPVQVSWISQVPADGRQTVDEGRNASAGQMIELPGHVSLASQVPAEARQTAPKGLKTAGHVLATPLHTSSASQLFAGLVIAGLQT